MESLKTTSRLTTLGVAIILGIITYISTMNPDNLANYLGVYGNYSAIIILICGFIINQYSEESRVKRAEDLVHNEYATGNNTAAEVNTTTDTIPETEIFTNNEEDDQDDRQ